VHSGEFALAAMYLRRVEIDGRSYAAARTQVSTVAMPPAVAAHNIGVGPCRGACGDMLEAIARIAPSQPNKAMARIAPRSPMVPIMNNKNFHSTQATGS